MALDSQLVTFLIVFAHVDLEVEQLAAFAVHPISACSTIMKPCL